MLHLVGGERVPLKVRSMVGLIPMYAATTLGRGTMERLPEFTGRFQWFLQNREHFMGVIGHANDGERALNGGAQMLQLSFDGRRLYVTNSLYSTWDNQFYPELRSWLLRIDCDPSGGMEIDHDFFVDFHDRPGGPARAHEVRLQNGDCTTEIFQ